MKRVEGKKPAPTKPRKRDFEVIERKFEVMTPMFGGGVANDKQPDPVTPVRAASVRGQLRFWWRATHAHGFKCLGDLWDEESRIWGAASKPAAVSIEVRGDVKKRGIEIFGENAQVGHGIKYATFPLRPDGELTKLDGTIDLVVRAPKSDAKQVHDAIDAWLLFGGIGARTRRGFGAVAPVSRALSLDEFWKRFEGASSNLGGVSALAGGRLEIGQTRFSSSKQALECCLGTLYHFRQGVGFARNTGPGRSRWPEPDAIRTLTGVYPGRHAPRLKMKKFPRAAFGMPIIFEIRGAGEPPKTTLLPAGKDRRASPLLLRPVRLDGAYLPMALILNDSARKGEPLQLKGYEGSDEIEATLDCREAQDIAPLAGNPDPLDAFLQFFRTRTAR